MLVALILHKNICKYHLDKETDLYYLNSRYYDPEVGRFIGADAISELDAEEINGLNLYRYCANNPVMMNDTEGNAPAWWEWVVSGILIVVGTVLCATLAGSAFGAGLIAAGGSMMASNIMSAIGVDGKVASIISAGLNIVAGVALCFTPLAALGASMIGSGVGSIGGGFLSEALGFGFQAGAMIGGIVGGIVGGQIHDICKFSKIAKQGVTIGKGMERVRAAASQNGTTTYKAMNKTFYKIIHKIFPKFADKLSIRHNKIWINKVMNYGGKIYDIGLGDAISPGLWYGMELSEIAKRGYNVIKYIFP